jgi:hypothetical protein
MIRAEACTQTWIHVRHAPDFSVAVVCHCDQHGGQLVIEQLHPLSLAVDIYRRAVIELPDLWESQIVMPICSQFSSPILQVQATQSFLQHLMSLVRIEPRHESVLSPSTPPPNTIRQRNLHVWHYGPPLPLLLPMKCSHRHTRYSRQGSPLVHTPFVGRVV